MTDNQHTLNPLLGTFDTPHATVPYNDIKTTDFEPAIIECIARHDDEIKAITDNSEAPTFENTIEALDKSGFLLERATAIFGNMLSTDATEELHAIAAKVIPILTEHGNNVGLNEKLFQRVKAVYDKRSALHLNHEQEVLLEDSYIDFVRSGVNLEGKDKKTYRRLTERLSRLELSFEQNCLKNMNGFVLNIKDKDETAGLPDNILEAAAETAKERGMEGYVFTLQAPSFTAFMRYAENRELRQKMFTAYNMQGVSKGDSCNIPIVRQIVNTRLAVVKLMGYKDYASFVLERRMAKDKRHVFDMLGRLQKAYMPTARKEVKELEAFAKEREGSDFVLMPWDWSYYSDKLKEKRYHIDTELLRPYLELDKVREGVFGLAHKLYGISFERNKKIQVYQKDVEAYDVLDKDGAFLAVLYLDFFPREGKQAGGWTSSLSEQWTDTTTGENHRPQVLISTNFTKPTATKPALLTFDEMRTLLHEFGHSLHAMFSNVTYRSLGGTNVYWDFVELPSQFMENYAIEKDFLHTFARHYRTEELMPDEYVQHIVDADKFNVAYGCIRQVGLGLIDMAWYTRRTSYSGNVISYERNAEKDIRLMPKLEGTCISTQFSHIFNGGYSAGYYSYKWAEVLEADAFAFFKEKGIFDAATALSFRSNILSKGSTEEPMTLYKRFRGHEPTIDALLIRDGIKKKRNTL
jgi:peptidyl-dipeptidase Dcp